MKILWVSNVLFSDVCIELGMTCSSVGGWMESSAKALIKNENIELSVAALYSGSKIQHITKYKIKYYLIPSGKNYSKYDKNIELCFYQIINSLHPDLIHIHGTEYPHSLACARMAGNIPVVVSIQGLVSVYAKYFMGGLDDKIIRQITTLKDLLTFNGLVQQQKSMSIRGEFEKELLQKVKHIIGRTSWDRSCVWAINPNVHYHFCNETLRDSFYTKRWSYDKCSKHTIFLSQGHYPIKGFHKMLEAFPLVLRHYPDTRIILSGHNFMNVPFYRISGYGKYCNKLIKLNGLEGKIEFIGMIDESLMASQFEKAHVFICPSSIENSPNSVGEAQLVGTPVIGSYVGGTMDMIKSGESGFLYRFEETPLLAQRICELFASPELCSYLSKNEREIASVRHDAYSNAKQLIKIYIDIISNGSD